MYLKSLELQGFKSFPDKIKLSFDKGLTAVVGPNGSGKSNIGDSIRWVMGEQSTKTLRGNKMEDVIFSGTVARKQVGFAMVTLTLDNSDHVLASEDDEVSVTRKLYRSGDSEYKINGKNVRLKDINELFMDTGMGRDGYSIIGQGRIAEIVSAKSSERRDIFEEAAGISKFRYKKVEAERKLSAAEDNLTRLNDIVSELENRIGPLKRQAEKAEKYIKIAQEKKVLEVSVWVDKLGTLKEKITGLEDELLIAKTEYENIQSDIEREEEKIKEGYRRIQESSAAADDLKDKILKTEQSSSQYRSDIAVCENDISHSEGMIEQLSQRKSDLEKSGERAVAQAEEKLRLAKEISEETDVLSREIETLKTELEQIQSDSENITKSSEQAGNDINKLYVKLSEYRSEAGSSDSSAEDTAQQLDSLKKQREQLKELAEQYEQEKTEISDGIKVFDEKSEELQNKANGVMHLFDEKSRRLEAKKKEQQGFLFEIKGKEQRKKLLSELERNMEGFARSVKEIVKASRSGRIGGIRGTVAQLIDVDKENAVAIETALGGAMQNIVVDDDNSAKRCIRYLKEGKMGRATFLPVSSIKGRLLNEQGLYNEDGFVAMANELVRTDERYRQIVDSLLGRTAVAEDIDMAAVIARKYGYRFRIVTLDGQIVNAGGSFTGGSAAHSAGVFSRKNELEQIDRDIETLKKSSEQSAEAVSKLALECEQLRSQAQQIKGEAEEVNEDRIKFRSELVRIEALAKQSQLQSEEFSKRYEQLIEKRNNAAETAKTARENYEKTKQLIRNAEDTLAREQQKREELRRRREELSSNLSDKKIRYAELMKDKESAEREAQSIKNSIEDSETALKQIEIQQKELSDTIEQRRINIAECKQKLDTVKTDIEGFERDIKKWQQVHSEQEMYVNQLRSGVRDLNEAKEKYSGEISKADERKLSAQRDLDSIVDRLYEVYELTRSEAEQQAEKIDDMPEAQKKLSELKSQIRSLGNVNVGAVEEYKEVSERYEFLSGQLNDVITSKKELEDLIDDLTADMCRIFAESFTIINRNFSEIFVELFGGGKAELVLLDPENVLESGIEIRVAPPGKVIKNLISLSGGEQSFVAICIYFAILRLRPAPFCILDEIDAALDEVNVKKYAQYLKNFTDTTQFVLVTHRRSAMEEANVLYGVTMQEDGISKLLRMEQSDIEKSDDKEE